jgi:hypothetical protein
MDRLKQVIPAIIVLTAFAHIALAANPRQLLPVSNFDIENSEAGCAESDVKHIITKRDFRSVTDANFDVSPAAKPTKVTQSAASR